MTGYYTIPAERLCANWTDWLVVINEEDYRRVRRLPVRGEVYWVPGVGVPLEECRASTGPDRAARLSLAPSDPVVLAAGGLSATRNMAQVLGAWRLVVREIPAQRARLERLVARLKISDRLHFLGARPDLSTFPLLADVVGSTSRREGLPRFIMEDSR